MKRSTDRLTAVYEPPRLIELGRFATVTLAEGNHYGKVMGGSDAFVMLGHGEIAASSA
jgi:hypothetical protein